MMTRDEANGCRYTRGDHGHYESWFMRANHAERPLGFWIRYTIFSPRGNGSAAVGELWAIWFDGERDQVKACKQVVPINTCRFAEHGLDVSVAKARLDTDGLVGEADGQGHRLRWSLRISGGEEPLLIMPERFYEGGFPKAKVVVPRPRAVFHGEIEVDGETHDIDGWVGSQNHNWGSGHTDRYVWAQVVGFDDEPDTHLEVATARVRVGPVWLPQTTVMVLRIDGEEHALNDLVTAVRASARYDFFRWSFESTVRGVSIAGNVAAPASTFVGLPYDNPPGGRLTCLNSKLASCHLTLRRPGRPPRSLVSRHRAAMEIVTDARDHGVPMLAA